MTIFIVITCVSNIPAGTPLYVLEFFPWFTALSPLWAVYRGGYEPSREKPLDQLRDDGSLLIIIYPSSFLSTSCSSFKMVHWTKAINTLCSSPLFAIQFILTYIQSTEGFTSGQVSPVIHLHRSSVLTSPQKVKQAWQMSRANGFNSSLKIDNLSRDSLKRCHNSYTSQSTITSLAYTFCLLLKFPTDEVKDHSESFSNAICCIFWRPHKSCIIISR